MQGRTPGTEGARLILLEEGRVRTICLSGRARWSIGRMGGMLSEEGSILFHSPLISRDHGFLRALDDQWYYVEASENKNGTFYNGKKLPKPRNGRKCPVPLENGDILRIDYEDLNQPASDGVLMLFTTTDICGEWDTFALHKSCSVQLCKAGEKEPNVHEAQIMEANGIYYLSGYGTEVLLNGVPLQDTAVALQEKSCIEICGSYIFLTENRLIYTKAGNSAVEIIDKNKICYKLCKWILSGFKKRCV